jgi:hypothetical protein
MREAINKGRAAMTHQLKRFVTSVAGLVVVMTPAAMLAVGSGNAAADGSSAASSQGPTTVAMSTILRTCDFSNDTHIPAAGDGQAYSLISRTGSTVTAEVHLYSRLPFIHHNVRLIEMPRPSSAPCGPGQPGTGFGSIDTDWAGNGTTTIQAPVAPGATGAWVFIEGPDGGNTKVMTGDFWTSDFVAAI